MCKRLNSFLLLNKNICVNGKNYVISAVLKLYEAPTICIANCVAQPEKNTEPKLPPTPTCPFQTISHSKTWKIQLRLRTGSDSVNVDFETDSRYTLAREETCAHPFVDMLPLLGFIFGRFDDEYAILLLQS